VESRAESDGLSQKAIAYLQEKTQKAKSNEKHGIAVSAIGLLLAISSVIGPRFLPQGLQVLTLFSGFIGGLMVLALGLTISLYYTIEIGVLKQEKNCYPNPQVP